MYSDSDGFAPASIAEASTATLFGRTMTVLTGMLAVTAMFSRLSWGWQPGGVTTFILVLMTFGCVFWAGHAMKRDTSDAVIPSVIFSVLWGLLLGPVVAEYTKILSAELVTYALLGTLGLTAVFGLIGYTANLAYQKMEGFLMMGLLGLIVFGVGFLLFGMPAPEIHIGYCLIGILVFIGFFMVDFARLKDMGRLGERGWGQAAFLALSIYLDMLNVFLYILQIMSNTKRKD